MAGQNPSTFVNSITCFDARNQFDAHAQREHFQRLAAAKIGVYVGGGEAGDGLTLSSEERHRLLQLAKEELKGKVPVRVGGFETRRPQDAVELHEESKEFGFEAMQVFGKEGHGGGGGPAAVVEDYFKQILTEVKAPVVLASSESAGYIIPLPVLKTLVASYPQIVGLTVNATDVGYTASVRQEFPNLDLHIMSPVQVLVMLPLGLQGFVSNEANIAPKTAMALIEAYKRHDLEGVSAAYTLLMNLYNAGAGGKNGLRALGYAGMHARRPWLQPSDADVTQLTRKLDTLQVRKIEGLP